MRAINQNRVARKSCSKNWKLRRSWTVIKTNKGFYVIKKIDERCWLLRSGAKHKWRIFELKISLRTFFVLRAGWLPSRVRCDVAASAVSNDAHLGWCWELGESLRCSWSWRRRNWLKNERVGLTKNSSIGKKKRDEIETDSERKNWGGFTTAR